MASRKRTRGSREKLERKRRHRHARETKPGRSSSKHRPFGPRSKSARQQATYDRALRALTLMRRGESLSSATRAEHIKPETFLRHVGTAVRQDKPGGRFRALPTDQLRRDDLQVPTVQGYETVAVRGSRAARQLAKYLNAVARFNRTGDESALRPFKDKSLTVVGGRRIEFLTNAATLMRLAEADALRLDSLYASASKRP